MSSRGPARRPAFFTRGRNVSRLAHGLPSAPASIKRSASPLELRETGGRWCHEGSIRRTVMGRGLLLWLIGIPLPIILIVWLLGGLHG